MDNLLPEEEKKLIRREFKFRIMGVFLLLCFTIEIFGLAFLLPAYIYSSTRESLAKVKKESLGKLKDEDEKTFTELKKLQGRIVFLMPSEHISFSRSVGKALSHVDNNVRLQSIKLDVKDSENHTLIVKGRADSRQALLDFSSALKHEQDVESVDIPVSSFADNSNIDFTATISIHYKSI